MAAKPAHVALTKLLAAAAWADGRVENDEINAIKHCMLHFKLSAEQVAEVTHLLETPIPRSQGEALTEEFLAAVKNDEEKRMLLAKLTELLQSDGDVTPEEQEFLLMVREIVESHGVLDVIVDRVKSLFTWGALRPKGKRSSSLADVLRTRLQKRVKEQMATLSTEAALDATELNRAVLFGALLQKVAFADGEASADECDKIGELLTGTFGYEPEETRVIVDTIGCDVTSDVDVQRLVSEFNRVTDLGGRLDLLNALFRVADADGTISDAEVDEIRRIADFMWIDRREFNDLRLAHRDASERA